MVQGDLLPLSLVPLKQHIRREDHKVKTHWNRSLDRLQKHQLWSLFTHANSANRCNWLHSLYSSLYLGYTTKNNLLFWTKVINNTLFWQPALVFCSITSPPKGGIQLLNLAVGTFSFAWAKPNHTVLLWWPCLASSVWNELIWTQSWGVMAVKEWDGWFRPEVQVEYG